MKNKIIFPIVLFIIIGSSLIAFYITNSAPPNLPMAVFSIACTILLAALALPSLLGISDSKIVKGLFFILYNNFVHIFFPIYQVILAGVALTAEYSIVECNNPIFISRMLLVLTILDLFYLLFYIRYLVNSIGSPGQMLKMFEKRIIKKIGEKARKGHEEVIFSDIQMLGKISKDTGMGDEKSAALNIFQKLLTEVTQLNSLDEEEKNIPTESQYWLWKSLVENLSEICQNNNDLYSANENNISEAIKILNYALQSTNHWARTGFDYAVCTRAIKKLAHYAIRKGYDNSVNEAARILGEIAPKSIPEPSEARISAPEIASDMANIGIAAVKAGRDDLADQFIIRLLYFFGLAEGKDMVYLFYVLKLMSFVWDKNGDALQDLSKTLSGIEKRQIAETVKYGSIHFPRETSRIKRFLEAVNKEN